MAAAWAFVLLAGCTTTTKEEGSSLSGLFSGAGETGTGPAVRQVSERDRFASAEYSRFHGRLTASLPGAVEENLDAVAEAVRKAGLVVREREGDKIQGSVTALMSDKRTVTVDLSGKALDITEVRIRVAPARHLDPILPGGDEDASRLLLQYIRVEAGLNPDGTRR